MRFKSDIIIIFIILIVIGLITGVFFSIYSPNRSLPIVDSTPRETPESVKDVDASNFTRLVSMGENICEGCHLSGKKFIPQAYQVEQHKEGGAYCLKCHIIDHNVHPMNENVTCEGCHGTTSPQIPEFREGTISCARCHDFPDPLKPSDGNLVVIHRPRNVDCAECHLDASESCLKCHFEIKQDEKWEKRLGHFRALLRTPK